ncbi:glycerophosphodiester phosphodiesterase [Chitinolyticbacter albus]|uniref:glycerophosphodiester phosphodiesterase n=1 Tax=Chitinolyticbacter albus TaxID=2961951 RepID=UPI00210E39C5|nr:glycerophosphodiester phosphodiesterase [Chitinolyticbacter albus]
MQLIAHRGLARSAPENSLAAFADALSCGFHGIETDVRLSADGEAVLFHSRTVGAGIPVAALSRAELSHLAGYLVPTLTEALDAFPDAFWNIEIKTPAAAPVIQAELGARSARQRPLLTSLRHEVIVAAAQATQPLDYGFIVWHRPVALNSLLYAAMPYSHLRTLVWFYESLDLALLQQANALGFRNYVFGAQTDHEHRLCEEFALHGLITDHPEYVGLTVAPPLQ